MKKLFYVSIVAILFASCMNQSKYELSVKLEGINEGTYYLMARIDGNWVKSDSADIVDGSAVFKRSKIDFPEMQYIQLKGQRMTVPVFVENSNIEVIGDKAKSNEIIINGSKTQDELKKYKELEKPYNDKMQQLNVEYRAALQAKNNEKVEQIKTTAQELSNEIMELKKNFIKDNPKSIAATYLLIVDMSKYELDELDKLVNSFDPEIENSKYITQIKEHINILKSVAIGQKFVDFTMNNANDQPIALSSIVGQGKYVLIDFWASWCRPCRAENPNVVAAYNHYKDKGFDVVGISLDQKKEDWLKAIQDDKLTWTQLCDIPSRSEEAANLYGITSIPSNFLIDKEGIIIAKNLRGEELINKIAELLN